MSGPGLFDPDRSPAGGLAVETDAGPGLLTPDRSPEPEWSVGYRRPPLATRFRPGQSGNPRGSRKRARTLGAAVAAALDEKVEVKENGRSRRITKLEAAAKQLANRAANGDQRAMQLVARLIETEDTRPAPNEPERLGKADAVVVAELVRRLSRPAQ